MLARMVGAVNVHETEARFSKLLKQVQLGEEIVIARAGKPAAQLVPFTVRPPASKPGTAKGLVTIGSDFDAPLPEEIQKAFE
jgi:prevent-host-death family protein